MKSGVLSVTVRELTRDWKKTSRRIKAGQAVPVTSDGKVVGTFVKAGATKLERKAFVPPGDAAKGERLVARMLRSL